MILEPSRLDACVERDAGDYATAAPYPHAVLTDVVAADALRAVAGEVEQMAGQGLSRRFDNAHQVKAGVGDQTTWLETTHALMQELNSGVFVGFLESLTGIDGLIGDPWFIGGGVHEVPSGGHLQVHADFGRHPTLALDRRLNVIVYLNEDWDPSWGGAIELWGPDMDRCVTSVVPELGTVLVFTTTRTSFHGHPEPVRCPPERARRSLATYYYTVDDSGRGSKKAHPTLWQGRPGQDREVRDWIPPAAVDIVRTWRARRRRR